MHGDTGRYRARCAAPSRARGLVRRRGRGRGRGRVRVERAAVVGVARRGRLAAALPLGRGELRLRGRRRLEPPAAHSAGETSRAAHGEPAALAAGAGTRGELLAFAGLDAVAHAPDDLGARLLVHPTAVRRRRLARLAEVLVARRVRRRRLALGLALVEVVEPRLARPLGRRPHPWRRHRAALRHLGRSELVKPEHRGAAARTGLAVGVTLALGRDEEPGLGRLSRERVGARTRQLVRHRAAAPAAAWAAAARRSALASLCAFRWLGYHPRTDERTPAASSVHLRFILNIDVSPWQPSHCVGLQLDVIPHPLVCPCSAL